MRRVSDSTSPVGSRVTSKIASGLPCTSSTTLTGMLPRIFARILSGPGGERARSRGGLLLRNQRLELPLALLRFGQLPLLFQGLLLHHHLLAQPLLERPGRGLGGLGLGLRASAWAWASVPGCAMSGFSTFGSGFATGGGGAGWGLGASTRARAAAGPAAALPRARRSRSPASWLCQRTPRNMTPTQQRMHDDGERRRSGRAPARGARRCRSRGPPARSLGGFTCRPTFCTPLLAQLVHHLQHRLVARVLVAADQHRELAGLAGLLDEAPRARRA